MVHQYKLSKVLALAGLHGATLENLKSAIKQALEHPDCGAWLAFLDVAEIWRIADLQDDSSIVLLHQRLGGGK